MEYIPKPEEHFQTDKENSSTKEPKEQGLYDIIETDNNEFEVILPGLVDYEIGGYVGTTKLQFKSREEAEKAIDSSREGGKILFELCSLKKSFIKDFYEIDETEDGKYKVTIPGLIDSETGYYIGSTSKQFDFWQEAKDFYLKHRENLSKLAENPLLEIYTSKNEHLSFSDFDKFNPIVAPSDKPKEIPQSIEKYIQKREESANNSRGASTYQETIKEGGWKNDLFGFVSSYLERDGNDIAQELGLKNIDSLTPRQAIDLTTRLIVKLTKYKKSDAKEKNSNEHLTYFEKSDADKSTTLDLLIKGRDNKDNDNWEGNGVCRNFACMTKAVFEALKANQTKFNRLQDTYCLYSSDTSAHSPKRVNYNSSSFVSNGHAWNPFITISGNKANTTIIDTTWAKKNLDNGKVEGLDYTLTRIEPLIHKIALKLNENSPNKKEQLEHILSYYQLKIENPVQLKYDLLPINKLDADEKAYYKQVAIKYYGAKCDLNQTDDEQLIKIGQQFSINYSLNEIKKEENRFFISQVMDIIKEQKDIPNISPILLKIIGTEYTSLAENSYLSEIETLWRIKKLNPDFSFEDILKSYLKNKHLDDYHSRDFITRNDELQLAIFEQIKTRSEFEKLINDSPSFRIRMREILPKLFNCFSPGKNQSDAIELKYLINDSPRLSCISYLFEPRTSNEKSANTFFQRAREILQKVNLRRYEEIAGNLDDYELIKKYNSIYSQLQKNK